MSRPTRNEAGFTLVELLLVIVILGLLLTPVALTFTLAARTTGDTASRATVTIGLNTVTAYFGNDVQGAKTVIVPGAGAPCGASGNPVVTFQGTDQADTTLPSTTSTAYTTAYLLRDLAIPNPASPQRQLVRVSCGGGAAQESVVASSVSTGTQASCTPSCTPSATSPATVSLMVKAFPPSLSAASDTTTYDARRRAP